MKIVVHKTIKYIFFLLITIVYACQSKGQDAILLLNNQSPLYFNPAYAGFEDYTRLSLNYRNHFPAVDKGFVTYGASFDTYLKNVNSGIGFSIMRDQPGNKAYSYTNAMLAYSYRINIDENKSVRAGLLGNFYYSVKDPSKLTFPDMIGSDGGISNNSTAYDRSTAIGVDIGTGIIYNSPLFMIGSSLYHLGNKNDSSYHHRQLKFAIHTEFRIPLYKRQTYANPQSAFKNLLKEAYLKPNIYYWQQGYTKVAGIGLDLHTKNLRFGISNRQDIKFESMIFSARVGFAAAFLEIDYIFDIGKVGSNFKGLSATSHEIGIIFKFGEEKEY